MAHRSSRNRHPAARHINTLSLPHKVLRPRYAITLRSFEQQQNRRAENDYTGIDRRTFHPHRTATVTSQIASPDRKGVTRSLQTLYSSPWRVSIPAKVRVCVQRVQRRQVLFATRGTGKGSKSKRHYNAETKLHCK